MAHAVRQLPLDATARDLVRPFPKPGRENRWLRFKSSRSLVISIISSPFASPHQILLSTSGALHPASGFPRPQTVASFLIFPRADPLLSSKSVASFFKKLSAFSHQPSGSNP